MNYRHDYHAGNFADCMKHALLVALLRALARKPAPFFVLDTHAGGGHYALGSEAALRTGEAAGGIMRLCEEAAQTSGHLDRHPQDPLPPHPQGALPRRSQGALPRRSQGALPRHPRARPGDPFQDTAARDPRVEPVEPGDDGKGYGDAAPLADYLSLVDSLGLYPGSPALIRALLRPDDQLACCELLPEDHARLRRLFRGDRQISVHQRDGWEALKALLPPTLKRGLVLIDPPYEHPDEFARLAAGLALANTRFPAGVLAAWYPVKHRAPVREFFGSLRLRDVIAAELLLREPLDPTRLNGCGLLIVKPPYRFEQEAEHILSALLERLGDREPGEAATVTRLADE